MPLIINLYSRHSKATDMCRSCRDRTGVQLKDKWRNLVKFKHVSRVEADVAASKAAATQSRYIYLQQNS